MLIKHGDLLWPWFWNRGGRCYALKLIFKQLDQFYLKDLQKPLSIPAVPKWCCVSVIYIILMKTGELKGYLVNLMPSVRLSIYHLCPPQDQLIIEPIKYTSQAQSSYEHKQQSNQRKAIANCCCEVTHWDNHKTSGLLSRESCLYGMGGGETLKK